VTPHEADPGPIPDLGEDRAATERSVDRAVEVPTRSGWTVRLRQARPGDEEALLVGFAHLSEQSRYTRFFTALPRLPERLLAQLTDLDGRHRMAIAAFDPSRPSEVGGPDGFGVAVARYIQPDPEVADAELAIAIIDDYQRKGLGHVLLTGLEIVGRANGLDRLHAVVLGTNFPMTRLLVRHGAVLVPEVGADPGVRRYSLDLGVDPRTHADAALVDALEPLAG
jgi:GNAT superfamily N-acetyltransferase